MGIPAGSQFAPTVAGVLAYVPELELDETSDAPLVSTFLGVTGPMVTNRIGVPLRALTALDSRGIGEAGAVVAAANLAATSLAQMGAASLLQDSRYPELAGARQTDQAWGSALWGRFLAALDALAVSLAAELARLGVGIDDPDAPTADRPDVSGPPAFFHDHMRW